MSRLVGGAVGPRQGDGGWIASQVTLAHLRRRMFLAIQLGSGRCSISIYSCDYLDWRTGHAMVIDVRKKIGFHAAIRSKSAWTNRYGRRGRRANGVSTFGIPAPAFSTWNSAPIASDQHDSRYWENSRGTRLRGLVASKNIRLLHPLFANCSMVNHQCGRNQFNTV